MGKKEPLELTVILPARDEPYVHTLERQIHEVLHDVNHEVLIQDEPGITHAVLRGVERSKGDIVAVMDGDGSHDPTALLSILRLYRWIKPRYINVVATYRFWNLYPLHRQIISLVTGALTQTVLGLEHPDPLTAFMVARRGVWNLVPPIPGCKWSLEILCRVDPETVWEFPITHVPREGHKSKLKPLELWYLLRQVIRLWREKRRNSSSG